MTALRSKAAIDLDVYSTAGNDPKQPLVVEENLPVNAAELIERVAIWSEHDDRIIAAGVCGSYARGDAGPESDIDFCLVSSDPSSLLDDQSWINVFGSEARVAGPVEDYNLVQSIRVFYGDTEAEFGVTDRAWMELPIDRGTANVMNDGLRILYDPAGRLKKAAIYSASISQ